MDAIWKQTTYLSTVRSATEIRPRDDRRAQSPRYKVKVTADGKSYKTKVVLDSLYPSWNEMLTL